MPAGLLASAIADPNPVVFIENKTLYFRKGDVPDPRRARADRPGGDTSHAAAT